MDNVQKTNNGKNDLHFLFLILLGLNNSEKMTFELIRGFEMSSTLLFNKIIIIDLLWPFTKKLVSKSSDSKQATGLENRD
jgi:hypothetical protein